MKMESKKLITILLRDVRELEELIVEMKATGSCDLLEMELLLTRMSGVRHLLEVFGESIDHRVPAVEKVPAAPVFEPALKQEPAPAPIAEPAPVVKEAVPVVAEVARVFPPKTEPVGSPAPAIVPEPAVVQPEVVFAAEPVQPAETDDDGDEMELEEEQVSVNTEKQTLGEKFVVEKSMNDLLIEKNKGDYKFSKMPVGSLQAAIGINDRFLFIRELFDGKADAFAQTIQQLDSMHSTHEAAVYLRENFKWKKSETSLKFMDLVKRRYQ